VVDFSFLVFVVGVALKQSLIKLIQITLMNEQIARACFEKKIDQNMLLTYSIE
jgi:hypothetical protein